MIRRGLSLPVVTIYAPIGERETSIPERSYGDCHREHNPAGLVSTMTITGSKPCCQTVIGVSEMGAGPLIFGDFWLRKVRWSTRPADFRVRNFRQANTYWWNRYPVL